MRAAFRFIVKSWIEMSPDKLIIASAGLPLVLNGAASAMIPCKTTVDCVASKMVEEREDPGMEQDWQRKIMSMAVSLIVDIGESVTLKDGGEDVTRDPLDLQ